MAEHIDSVAASAIPKVGAAEFWGQIQNGDLILCSGADGISVPIERETGSPFSHVLQAWIPADLKTGLAMQSTIQRGVSLDLLGTYQDYQGDLVLCRRALSEDVIYAIQRRFLGYLGDKYDWITELGIAAHKILGFLPVIDPRNEYYCSGIQVAAAAMDAPFALPESVLKQGYPPTPEQVFTDPTVTAVCALLKGAT